MDRGKISGTLKFALYHIYGAACLWNFSTQVHSDAVFPGKPQDENSNAQWTQGNCPLTNGRPCDHDIDWFCEKETDMCVRCASYCFLPGPICKTKCPSWYAQHYRALSSSPSPDLHTRAIDTTLTLMSEDNTTDSYSTEYSATTNSGSFENISSGWFYLSLLLVFLIALVILVVVLRCLRRNNRSILSLIGQYCKLTRDARRASVPNNAGIELQEARRQEGIVRQPQQDPNASEPHTSLGVQDGLLTKDKFKVENADTSLDTSGGASQEDQASVNTPLCSDANLTTLATAHTSESDGKDVSHHRFPVQQGTC